MSTNMMSFTIKILSGREYLVHNGSMSGNVSFTQQNDGIIVPDGYYPQGCKIPTYEIQSYKWNGPVYETVHKNGGGSLFGIGAKRGLLGSMLGAAVQGGKNRTFDKEIKGKAFLTLKNLQTEDVFTILFECDSAIDVRIRNLLRKTNIAQG